MRMKEMQTSVPPRRELARQQQAEGFPFLRTSRVTSAAMPEELEAEIEEEEILDERPGQRSSSARRYQQRNARQVPQERAPASWQRPGLPVVQRRPQRASPEPPREPRTQRPRYTEEPVAPLPRGQRYTGEPVVSPVRQRGLLEGRRLHWLVWVGLAMLIMIVGWVALSALGTWWTNEQNDWTYGNPRTFQVDAVVGHHDSTQNPSHFIAMNLNRHIVIIEIPGGDPSKSVIYSGPTLVGTDQDLTPVTLEFEDVNGDGKPDMIVVIQGNQIVFLNENGTFVPENQSK